MSTAFDPTDYELAVHGDSRQRRWAKRIGAHFPHYEEVWRHYVVPLTFQVVEPGNYFVRPTIDPLFEDLADTQYAVYFHLAQMHEWRVHMDNRGEAKYVGGTEALYVFFSHGTSMLDATLSFAAAVDAVVEAFGGEAAFDVERDEYDHPVTLGDDWGMAGDRANWHGLRNRIRDYRNLLVHHRPVFMQNDFVPRVEYLEAMSGLTAVSRVAREPELLDERYEPVVPMMTSLLEQAGAALDGAWVAALQALRTTDTEGLRRAMLRIAPEDADLDRERILGLRGRRASRDDGER